MTGSFQAARRAGPRGSATWSSRGRGAAAESPGKSVIRRVTCMLHRCVGTRRASVNQNKMRTARGEFDC